MRIIRIYPRVILFISTDKQFRIHDLVLFLKIDDKVDNMSQTLSNLVLCHSTFYHHDPRNTLGVAIHVFGPETHMTSIVSMALGKRDIPTTPARCRQQLTFYYTGGVSIVFHIHVNVDYLQKEFQCDHRIKKYCDKKGLEYCVSERMMMMIK
ncbi:hypothetical protein KUTeg_008205 [Tegillarca granosa]|uniref:Uncharacterized protein n=1 Tax=Tegillarca granosa TaxID=220873 RepID=A0ABQ9F8G7_TEGGR|nr:hypothetical protein KUTeg_008205 [Tegillarca granosa]